MKLVIPRILFTPLTSDGSNIANEAHNLSVSGLIAFALDTPNKERDI